MRYNDAVKNTFFPFTQGMKDKSFKKLYQLGQGYVETRLVPYREVYPNATPKEYLTKS